MVKKWYVITKAGPGTRLGIYDNWLADVFMPFDDRKELTWIVCQA
jgi:hypothetical protein